MNRLDELRNYVNGMQEDFEKFYEKGNNSAGTRVRKALQGLKKLASDIRNEIQEKRKAEKGGG